MILPNNASGETLHADVCIIGGGPAAISVALKLINTSASVLLLVGGSPTHESAADQDLNRGIIARPGSHESLVENRRRVFGGASSAWGGRCIPFDPLDFKSRSWIPFSGWPFSYKDMEPFYREALTLCRAGSYDFDSRSVFPQKSPAIIPGLASADLEDWQLERWSPPINFSQEFQEQMKQAPNVRVFLNTHVLELVSSRREQVDLAKAISINTRFDVHAQTFVLATGGIENPRVLLASRSNQHPFGIGNDRDLVGRFYQAHPHGTFASLSPSNRKEINYEYERDSEGVYCRRRWSIPEATQQRLGINNIIFFLDRTTAAQGHRDAIFSSVFLAKTAKSILRVHGTLERWARLRSMAPDIRQHLGVILSDGFTSIPRLLQLVRARIDKKRRLPSVLPSVQSKYLGLYYQAEQVPNRDSRITLSPDTFDDHGVPRVVVNLAFTEQDIRTIIEAHRIFVQQYSAAGAGEILYDEEQLAVYVRQRFLEFNSAAHHLGTTRIATRPEDGVVDEDCRVHGLSNLYVAGSSTFPTGGHANPTLTIVALALRLGDHLSAKAAL